MSNNRSGFLRYFRLFRSAFFLKNLGKGLLWLALILVLFVMFKDKIDFHPESWIAQFSDRPFWVYLLYTASEIVVGIIPPELFMIWALKFGSIWIYIFNIFLLAVISYSAGLLAFFLGRRFHKTRFFRYLEEKFFGSYTRMFKVLGGILVFIAAVTPLPYSGICMIVGSVKYPFRIFVLVALARFVRFAVAAFFVYKANLI